MRRSASGPRSHISVGLTAAGIYLLAGTGWILVADRILDLYQSTKGTVFISLSSLPVAYLAYRVARQRAANAALLRGWEGVTTAP